MKVERYTGEKTYMWPNGVLATRENVLEECPAALTFVHIADTDDFGEVLLGIGSLAANRTHLGISPELSEDEAIAEIERIRNTPPPDPGPSPEERIAAAMEFQNLLNM